MSEKKTFSQESGYCLMWPNAPHTRTTQVVIGGLHHPVSGLCPQVQRHAAVSAGTSPLQVLLCQPLPQVWPMPFPPQWSESPLRICLLRKAVTFLLGLQERRDTSRWAGARRDVVASNSLCSWALPPLLTSAYLLSCVMLESCFSHMDFAIARSSWKESRHRAKFGNGLILTLKSRVASAVCVCGIFWMRPSLWVVSR